MKKILLPVILLFAVVLIALLFIASNVTISKISVLPVPANAISRLVESDRAWASWLVGTKSPAITGDSCPGLSYGGYCFHCRVSQGNVSEIIIRRKSFEVRTLLTVLTIGQDSTAVRWETENGPNPTLQQRAGRYFQMKQVERLMDDVLQQLARFATNPENVYGMKIERSSTTDTLLLVQKEELDHYPSTIEVYQLLDSVRRYVFARGAIQSGFPMLNVTASTEKNNFSVMVAIPVNKILPGSGNIRFMHMVPGFFMTATVTGGPYTIQKQLRQLQLSLDDNRQTSMAIPFEGLVTDRMVETDTTKWVTRLWMPVMR